MFTRRLSINKLSVISCTVVVLVFALYIAFTSSAGASGAEQSAAIQKLQDEVDTSVELREELEQDLMALKKEKRLLEAEHQDLVIERNRLADLKDIPGDPEENKVFNDAVFELRDRINKYEQRRALYNQRAKAYDEKIQSIQ